MDEDYVVFAFDGHDAQSVASGRHRVPRGVAMLEINDGKTALTKYRLASFRFLDNSRVTLEAVVNCLC